MFRISQEPNFLLLSQQYFVTLFCSFISIWAFPNISIIGAFALVGLLIDMIRRNYVGELRAQSIELKQQARDRLSNPFYNQNALKVPLRICCKLEISLLIFFALSMLLSFFESSKLMIFVSYIEFIPKHVLPGLTCHEISVSFQDPERVSFFIYVISISWWWMLARVILDSSSAAPKHLTIVYEFNAKKIESQQKKFSRKEEISIYCGLLVFLYFSVQLSVILRVGLNFNTTQPVEAINFYFTTAIFCICLYAVSSCCQRIYTLLFLIK